MSVKLKNGSVEVSFVDKYLDETSNTVVENDASASLHIDPHPDLLSAMKALSPHFAALCEQQDTPIAKLNDPATIEKLGDKFPVRGVIFKATDKYQGVQLSGHRKLSTGHVTNMLTRLVKFDDPAESYEPWDYLQGAVDTVRKEAIAALVEGKRQKPAQMTIEDVDPTGDDDGGDE